MDCTDGEDEENCYLNEKTLLFSCLKFNQKVSYTAICNHLKDCQDGSDEENCCLKYLKIKN